jgi:chloramphenicol-sensitive protein RarD
MQKGGLYAASAYILWGFLPLFWKALHGVPAIEILAHRMVWSLLVVLALLAYQGHWSWLRKALRDRRILLTFMTTAVVLSINWFVYIWAVNTGHVVETSLGYFINPLVNVLLGVLFLRERPRAWQNVAILVALSGVLYLTFSYGVVPWIALTLAFSFGLYGLLRKTASLNSLEGLTLETLLLFLPALAYLLWLAITGQGAFGTAGLTTTALLAASGIPTALPLLLFAAGARRITMTALGILQYIAPTIQFGLGVLVYHEPLTATRFVGFVLIWLACALYTAESIYHGRIGPRRRVAATPGIGR